MKIPIKLGEEVLYPESVILIKDRDRIIESVYQGKPAVEVDAKNIRCDSSATLQQALADGWEFFCAILPSGHAKFWLKDANGSAQQKKLPIP